MSKKERKVCRPAGPAAGPAGLLGQLLERANAGEIVSVAVSVEGSDERFGAIASNMEGFTLLAHARTLQSVADNHFLDEDDEYQL